MHILLLSFYFPPGLCAGSFRATALAKKLSEKLGSSDPLTVLTTVPNRYNSFQAESSSHVDWSNVLVVWTSLPSHKSGMIEQSKVCPAVARSRTHTINAWEMLR